jgi:hypothetical protein
MEQLKKIFSTLLLNPSLNLPSKERGQTLRQKMKLHLSWQERVERGVLM